MAYHELQYRLNLYAIAAVWAVNGLVCKVLRVLPRHELIVARILGPTYAGPLTRLFGVGELLVAAWVLSQYRPALAVWTQVALVLTMNVLEFFLAPDLLLWGRYNLVFAGLFSAFIVWNHQLTARQKA